MTRLQVVRSEDYYTDESGERFREVYKLAVREHKQRKLGTVLAALAIGFVFGILLYVGIVR